MKPFVSANQITLLRNGAEYFPALQGAIDSAQQEIHLQAYIYEHDATGQQIGLALMRAARRGVTVCLLLDGFGSRSLPQDYLQEMLDAGVQVMFYRHKISPWTFKRNRLRRLHRKVAVVDGRVAFVGGINIIDDMNVPGHAPPRLDYAVQVNGPLVANIQASIYRHWRRIRWLHFKTVHTMPRYKNAAAGNMRAAYVIRDNVLHRRDIERAYLKAIGNAKREILIANAYFLPGRRFRHALIAAAQRGVRVRLLLQGHMEYWIMHATHAAYSLFLRHGIEIYEYQKSFMHSKVAVIDGRWSTVGSSNIDPFSLLLAQEANVVIQDNHFAKILQQDIEGTIADGGYRIEQEAWRRGHLMQRLLSWVVYGLLRLMLAVIGYPKRHQ